MTKTILKTSTFLLLFSLTGCVQTLPTVSLNNTQTPKALMFKTSEANFMHRLKSDSTVEERNAFMDEFIFQSNIQCQNYLNNPLKKPETDQQKTSLYMNLFDSVASVFGISLITNTAKAVFLENNGKSKEEQEAFANALSPEIRKGVELGRSRYANKMIQNKKLNLQDYSIQHLRADTLTYDKQCSDTYGLIEINRALKEMQNAVNRPPSIATPAITNSVKDKVIAVTKEGEEQKEEKKEQEKSMIENNTTQVLPTQPKPVSVPSHHDNAPQMPHSIQL